MGSTLAQQVCSKESISVPDIESFTKVMETHPACSWIKTSAIPQNCSISKNDFSLMLYGKKYAKHWNHRFYFIDRMYRSYYEGWKRDVHREINFSDIQYCKNSPEYEERYVDGNIFTGKTNSYRYLREPLKYVSSKISELSQLKSNEPLSKDQRFQLNHELNTLQCAQALLELF